MENLSKNHFNLHQTGFDILKILKIISKRFSDKLFNEYSAEIKSYYLELLKLDNLTDTEKISLIEKRIDEIDLLIEEAKKTSFSFYSTNDFGLIMWDVQGGLKNEIIAIKAAYKKSK